MSNPIEIIAPVFSIIGIAISQSSVLIVNSITFGGIGIVLFISGILLLMINDLKGQFDS